MAWDFRTDPEYQEKLDWADAFVHTKVDAMKDAFLAPSVTKDAFIAPGPGRAHVNQPESRDTSLAACGQ